MNKSASPVTDKEFAPAVSLRGKRETEKPRLKIEKCSPDRTVAALRDIVEKDGSLFDRGAPVRLVFDQLQGGVVTHLLTPDALVLKAHGICRPYVDRKEGSSWVEVNAQLPRQIASMYLDWRGEWRLRPLNGIASSPLLRGNGSIYGRPGYDAATGMFLENTPNLAGLIPERPTKDAAALALLLIRDRFKTFCFADAETVPGPKGVGLVDTAKPPGKDESSFLVGLLTAVCRPSLHLAPAMLLRSAPMSGAGTGKGLLGRLISAIAYGREPRAFTGGGNAEEMDKRIEAELIEGGPMLFLDNLNNIAIKSNVLASAITERPARVRLLGKSQMVPLNTSAFIILTGNGLSVSEDLARRFLTVEFDAKIEDPEARKFESDIRGEVKAQRAELLAAALTIWRWGRLEEGIQRGRALGSFEQWSEWVRDPLLALGCQDPAEQVGEAKKRDARRQSIAALFAIWWEHHRSEPVTANKLHEKVREVVDPQRRGRQFVTSYLGKHVGTRMVGFVLTRQEPPGDWGAATYALVATGGAAGHRDHRDHKASHAPYAPYARWRRPRNRYIWMGARSMSAAEALKAARAAGVRIDMIDRKLKLRADRKPPAAVLDLLSRHKTEIVKLLSPPADDWSADDWQDFFNERASIAEFDGGLPRSQAEVRAFTCCVVAWLKRNPAHSLPGRCLHCGGGERTHDALLPFGIESAGHAWLHSGCWPDWYARRKAEAVAALAAMGIRRPAANETRPTTTVAHDRCSTVPKMRY